MDPKLHKFLSQPKRFFYDALQNRAADLAAIKARVLRPSTKRRYTIVSAVYGVEAYLEDFFRSIEKQALPFEKHIEVIMVDDGSLDGSAEIIKRWQRKYPSAIHYIRKENGGQASARNVGLEHATGDWVTFIDPDDFIHQGYFAEIDSCIEEYSDGPLGFISANLINFDERVGRFRNNHVLRHRFANGNIRILPEERDEDFIALHVSAGFFRLKDIQSEEVRFKEDVRPNFEDAHFIAQFLMKCPDVDIAYCARARYFYRKRANESSTLDGSWKNEGRYIDVFRKGYLDILKQSAERSSHGRPSIWVQRLVLYDLFWIIDKVLNRPEQIAFLEDEKKSEFFNLFSQCIELIETQTILDFNLAWMWELHKAGLIGLFKQSAMPYKWSHIDAYDEAKDTLRIRYYFLADDEVDSIAIDGVDSTPFVSKTRRHDFAGRTFIRERILWFRIDRNARNLTMRIGGERARIFVNRQRYDGAISIETIRSTLTKGEARTSSPWFVRGELKGAELIDAGSRNFPDGAFLFMDRDNQADDNAEHLYRYVKKHRPDIPAFFVLRRSSHDWARLEDEGFNLIPYGSILHRHALQRAKHLISSHADHYVVGYFSTAAQRRATRYKFTFLQHGIIKDDLSAWLNPKPIDLFITASPLEYESIVGADNLYRFTRREVRLTGLPRHDALTKYINAPDAKSDSKKLVLIMPTWRQSLVGKTVSKGNERTESDAFYESDYLRCWSAIIQSDELRKMAGEKQAEFIFFPHANMQIYLDAFEVPPHIKVMSHADASMQQLFVQSHLLVTDYSSVAFEMAYLQKHVVYYQFDRDSVFGGAHTTAKGYYDYFADGFGPVCDTKVAAIEAIRAAVSEAEPDACYLERMDRSIAFRDGRACERVLTAIEALDDGAVDESDAPLLLIERARCASQQGAWDLALIRWMEVERLGLEVSHQEVRERIHEAERELCGLRDGEWRLKEIRMRRRA